MIAIMQHLAAVSSVLPSDASALEASISALRNSISALDSGINALEGASKPWEVVAIASSFVVFFGIIGEVVVIISEYRDDMHDWRQGEVFWVWRVVLPPGRPPLWRFLVDIVATGIVLVGILGESWASLKLASINSQLRSETSVLRADSDQLLALVTQEAGNAADAAKRAQDSADIVGKEATKADASAAAVAKKAEQVNQALGMAQYLLLPRQVRDPDDLKKQLAQFTGKAILFRSYFNDSEGYFLCEEILSIAKSDGIVPTDQCGLGALGQFPLTMGINVFAPDDDTMLALNKAFAGVTPFGSGTGPFGNAPHSPVIVVFVGRKNTFHVGETAQTRTAEGEATKQKNSKKIAKH